MLLGLSEIISVGLYNRPDAQQAVGRNYYYRGWILGGKIEDNKKADTSLSPGAVQPGLLCLKLFAPSLESGFSFCRTLSGGEGMVEAAGTL